jgi:hypothetical protein
MGFVSSQNAHRYPKSREVWKKSRLPTQDAGAPPKKGINVFPISGWIKNPNEPERMTQM